MNNRAEKSVKLKLIKLKCKMDKYTMIVGDFDPPLTIVSTIPTQKMARL